MSCASEGDSAVLIKQLISLTRQFLGTTARND